jgi:hypothetical protein
VIGVENIDVTSEEISENPAADLTEDQPLSADQAEAIYDQAVDCGVDFRQVILGTVRQAGATEAQTACVEERLTDGLLFSAIVAEFTKDELTDDDRVGIGQLDVAAFEPCGAPS